MGRTAARPAEAKNRPPLSCSPHRQSVAGAVYVERLQVVVEFGQRTRR